MIWFNNTFKNLILNILGGFLWIIKNFRISWIYFHSINRSLFINTNWLLEKLRRLDRRRVNRRCVFKKLSLLKSFKLLLPQELLFSFNFSFFFQILSRVIIDKFGFVLLWNKAECLIIQLEIVVFNYFKFINIFNWHFINLH